MQTARVPDIANLHKRIDDAAQIGASLRFVRRLRAERSDDGVIQIRICTSIDMLSRPDSNVGDHPERSITSRRDNTGTYDNICVGRGPTVDSGRATP